MRRAVIKNKRSFTLVELMAAVAITLLVITGSALSFVQLMFLADSSVNLTIAVNDAQYVLEQVKSVPYASICGYSAPSLKNIGSSENIAFNCSAGANLATVTVNVSWQERGQAKNFSLSTYIAK